MSSYIEKKVQLFKMIDEYAVQDVMVAFSGGVDSTMLLKLCCEAAKKTGKQVYGVTMQTKLHPVREMEEAGAACNEIGATHMVIKIDELQEAGIMNNPINRCYLCKKYLFLRLRREAERLGISIIMEGTNEDDLHVYRPGIKALRELEIISPLAQAGLTKQEVRMLAAEFGLSVASKPSAPCLATRFPYGTELTYEKMAQVEKGETYLKEMGLHNVRMRVHDEIVRIEVNQEEFPVIMAHQEEIAGYLKQLGYVYITLDLEGFRSGSMDIKITGDYKQKL